MTADSDVVYRYLLIITYSLFIFFSGGIYQAKLFESLLLTLLPILALPLVLTFYLSDKALSKASRNRRFYFFLILAFALRILMVRSSPAPIIDVYTMLKEAPQTFLQGISPYETVFSTVYSGVKSDYFTYWPAAFLLQIPFVYIFRDPRVLLILADMASAWLIYILGKKGNLGRLLCLIYLFRPNSNFIIEQSYLVPLEFFSLALIVYILKAAKSLLPKKEYLAGAVFGVMMSLKPHYMMLGPFLLIKNTIQRFLGLSAILILTVLPFILWNPQAFKNDTVDYFLRPDDKITNVPIYHSLNLNSLAKLITGNALPVNFVLVFSLIVFLSLLYTFIYRFRSGKRYNDNIFLYHFLLCAIILLLTAYLFFRFAFINYYYFITNLIILLAVYKSSFISHK